MPRCTGIQLLDGAVRAVELKGSPRSPKLSGFAELPLDGGQNGESELGTVVRQLLHGARLGRDPAVLALNATGLKVRNLTVPFQTPEQIRKVIKTVVEEHLHGTPVENTLVVFHKVRDFEDGSSRVLTLAAEKAPFTGILSALQARGVDPQAAECDLSALYHFGRHAGAFPEKGCAVVLDLEPERTGILVVRDGELQTLRAFRMRLTGTAGGAEKEEMEEGGTGEASTAASPGPDVRTRLAREIERTLLAEGVDEEPEAVFVSGSLATDESLVTGLAGLTGLSPAPLPFPAGMEEAPRWAGVAAGAALKMFGQDPLAFDFRQGEAAFKRKFERVKGGATVLAVLAFLFFAVLGLHLDHLKKEEVKRHKRVANQAVLIFRQSLEKEKLPDHLPLATATRFVFRSLNKKMEDLTGKGMDKDVPPIQSNLTRWRDLATRMEGADGIDYLTVKEFYLNPKIFFVKGQVDSPRAVDSLLNAIKTLPGFSSAAIGSPPEKTEDGTFRYHIHAEID